MDLVQDVILNAGINDDQLRENSSIKSDNKFRKNGKYTDAAIQTRDGNLFSIHRNIMSANSSYFATIFDKDESNCNKIYNLLSDISGAYLDKIIDYIYTGIINVKFEDILIFDKYANEFDLNDLKLETTKFLIKNINEITCLEYWRHSVKFAEFDLESKCLKFIEDNTEIFLVESIYDLTFEEMLRISSNKHLCCTHELLYLYIFLWIKLEYKNRQQYIEELIKNVDFTSLSMDFIKSNILNDSILMANTEFTTKTSYYFEERLKNYPENEPPEHCLIRKQIERVDQIENEPIKVLTEEEQNQIYVEWKKFHLDNKMIKRLPPVETSNMIKYCELSLKAYNKLLTINDIQNHYDQNSPFELKNEPKKAITFKSNEQIIMLSKNWICRYNYDNTIEPVVKIEPRQRYATCSFNQHSNIFISGGLDLNTCEYYSNSTRSIHKIPSMYESRMWHSNIQSNDQIYSLGGYWNNGSFESFDLNAEKWMKNDSKMIKKDYDFGVINNGGSLYTFGGLTRNQGNSEIVERYDQREGKWKIILEEEQNLSNCKSICINDLVYCFGETKSSIFDIRKNRWRIKSFAYPINIELQWLHFDVLNIDKTIYVVGNDNYKKSFMYTFDYKNGLSWLELNIDLSNFEGYEYHLSKISSNDSILQSKLKEKVEEELTNPMKTYNKNIIEEKTNLCDNLKLSKKTETKQKVSKSKFYISNKGSFYGLSENSIYDINIIDNIIKPIVPIIQKHYYSVTNFNTNCLLLSGGIHQNLNANLCQYYCDTTKIINEFPAMIENRIHHQTILLNDQIYACGGQSNNGNCEIYNIKSDIWTKLSGRMIKKEDNFGIISYNNCIYTFGGKSNDKFSNSVERYDPRIKDWFDLNISSRDLGKTKSICIDNNVYSFGEKYGQIYDIRKNQWNDFIIYSKDNLSFSEFDVIQLNNLFYILGKNKLNRKLYLLEFDYNNGRKWKNLDINVGKYFQNDIKLVQINC